MSAPHLERYDIVGELGRGGMSVVYRAHDRQLDRPVAIKVLHHFLAEDPDARHRLRREAVAVARLRHPGILEIFDSSEPDGEDAYLVTELIDGLTLRAWLDARGAPPLPEATAVIGLALAQALRHAHERGIVHRDLKPENVMVSRGGQLKLMDFGIAQIMGGATRLTTTGALLGSPAHMPPEIIDGLPSDHRSDLFSLGTILYFLACGRLPFEAPNPSALFRRILEGQYEPPQAVAPAVGNGLARVLERALERDPSQRYQDVSELEADLLAELESIGWTPAPALLGELLIDPAGFCESRRAPLVEHLIGAGRSALREKRLARACDRLNRAGALAPDHPEVLELLERAARAEAQGPRRLRRAVWLAGGLAAAGFAMATTLGRPPATGAEASLGAAASGGVSAGDAPLAPERARPPLTERSEPAPSPGSAASPGPPRGAEIPPAPPTALARSAQPRGTAPASPTPRSGQASRSSRRTGAVGRAPAHGASPQGKTVPTPERASAPEAGPARGASSGLSNVPLPAPSAVLEADSLRRVLLRVRIGQSFADVVVDGVVRLRDRYRGDLRLREGLHTVQVVKPGAGRFRARTLEVTPDGKVLERRPDGSRRALVDGVLDFRIPLTAEEARGTPGWVSD